MSIAIIFPGQGSQYVNMGKSYYDNFQVAREVFEEVDNSLSRKLSSIIFGDDQEELSNTVNAQPAIMAVSIAMCRVIERESGKKIYEISKHFAGHSLGEFSALCAADAFSLSDVSKVLHTRATAMQSAVPVGVGGMVALVGAKFDDAKKLVEKCAAAGVCEIANDNGAGQIVISGEQKAMDKALEIFKEYGIRRAVPLKVSAPFHSSLIVSAAKSLGAKLAETEVRNPKALCYSNVSAKAYTDVGEIKGNLERQVTANVRWREIMHELAKSNQTFIEVGPGKVLTNLVKREIDQVQVFSFDEIGKIDEFLKII